MNVRNGSHSLHLGPQNFGILRFSGFRPDTHTTLHSQNPLRRVGRSSEKRLKSQWNEYRIRWWTRKYQPHTSNVTTSNKKLPPYFDRLILLVQFSDQDKQESSYFRVLIRNVYDEVCSNVLRAAWKIPWCYELEETWSLYGTRPRSILSIWPSRTAFWNHALFETICSFLQPSPAINTRSTLKSSNKRRRPPPA